MCYVSYVAFRNALEVCFAPLFIFVCKNYAKAVTINYLIILSDIAYMIEYDLTKSTHGTKSRNLTFCVIFVEKSGLLTHTSSVRQLLVWSKPPG